MQSRTFCAALRAAMSTKKPEQAVGVLARWPCGACSAGAGASAALAGARFRPAECTLLSPPLVPPGVVLSMKAGSRTGSVVASIGAVLAVETMHMVIACPRGHRMIVGRLATARGRSSKEGKTLL